VITASGTLVTTLSQKAEVMQSLKKTNEIRTRCPLDATDVSSQNNVHKYDTTSTWNRNACDQYTFYDRILIISIGLFTIILCILKFRYQLYLNKPFLEWHSFGTWPYHDHHYHHSANVTQNTINISRTERRLVVTLLSIPFYRSYLSKPELLSVLLELIRFFRCINESSECF
jgi:hypothetical protein